MKILHRLQASWMWASWMWALSPSLDYVFIERQRIFSFQIFWGNSVVQYIVFVIRLFEWYCHFTYFKGY